MNIHEWKAFFRLESFMVKKWKLDEDQRKALSKTLLSSFFMVVAVLAIFYWPFRWFLVAVAMIEFWRFTISPLIWPQVPCICRRRLRADRMSGKTFNGKPVCPRCAIGLGLMKTVDGESEHGPFS